MPSSTSISYPGGTNYVDRAGHTYWVKKPTDADFGKFLSTHNTSYEDGTVAVYTTIQAAVNAAMDKRGDTIIICDPSQGLQSASTKWTENVVVTKANLRIIADAFGWECQFRPGDATTKYGYMPVGGSAAGGFAFLLAARGIELAGFLFDGGGGYSGVYVGDLTNVTAAAAFGTNKNAASCYIHDCIFQGGNEGVYGINLDGCSANVIVERCEFNQFAKAGIYITPGGSRTVQHPIIRNNQFWASTAATHYGIDMYSSATTVGVNIHANVFKDGAAAVFTNPWRTQGAGVHTMTGNYLACTNAWSSPSSDWSSGNYKFNIAGNTTTTVSQA